MDEKCYCGEYATKKVLLRGDKLTLTFECGRTEIHQIQITDSTTGFDPERGEYDSWLYPDGEMEITCPEGGLEYALLRPVPGSLVDDRGDCSPI